MSGTKSIVSSTSDKFSGRPSPLINTPVLNNHTTQASAERRSVKPLLHFSAHNCRRETGCASSEVIVRV